MRHVVLDRNQPRPVILPGQFTRTIGNPAEECIEGPGKILMCRGNKREWVQGFYDDPDWLHAYATERRKDIAA